MEILNFGEWTTYNLADSFPKGYFDMLIREVKKCEKYQSYYHVKFDRTKGEQIVTIQFHIKERE